ncbi:MAG: amidase [Frankiales bacterium]|nr:amidase [Frankiales bacterium]
MSTWITRLDSTGDGPRLAVKDIIDVEGIPTTGGSRALERIAKPADNDAPCLAGARAAGARIVGKVNLHELAMLPIGTNPWFGSPVNPLDADRIPGGSSSGSAVAVAADEADAALGSDTGGSVRIPSACCGTAGLKTTYGRISTEGVWPLATTLDTIGPMARDIAGVVLGMQLLEPGFQPAASAATRIGRLRTDGDPAIESAIDTALRQAELDVVPIEWDGFETGNELFTAIYFKEIWDADHTLLESDADGLGDDIKSTMALCELLGAGYDDAIARLDEWRKSLSTLFTKVELLALPTMPIFPPRIEEVAGDALLSGVIDITKNVSLFNAAGVPATAQPVPAAGSPFPASLQLVGPHNSEELLVATAARVESAVG